MYINNEDFEKWMQKLSKKLSEIGQDLKSLINTKEVFDPDEKLLENQFHMEFRRAKRRQTAAKIGVIIP